MADVASTPPTDGERRSGETAEARIAKALSHPLRARLLQRLGERVAGPGELAVELGAPLGVVSYHVRKLRDYDYDCVELVRAEPRRGALQHLYRATVRPSLGADQWRSLPPGPGRELSGQTFQALVTDLGQAAGAGALEDSELVVSRTPLELDERGLRKLIQLLARTHERALLAIAGESSARVARGVRDRARDRALQARHPRLAPESALTIAAPFERVEMRAVRSRRQPRSGRCRPTGRPSRAGGYPRQPVRRGPSCPPIPESLRVLGQAAGHG